MQKCTRCTAPFDFEKLRGYCDSCIQHFNDQSQKICNIQHPGPGLCLDGVFVDSKECPTTIMNESHTGLLCGLCGSDQVESGYGIGSGYGMGCYNFCFECNTFLDFIEDPDD